MLLEFVQGFPLLLNHVSMGEWEVIDSLDGLHSLLVAMPFTFFVFKDLVRLDKRIDFVSLVLLLIQPFFVHLLALELKQALLVLPIPNLVNQLSIPLLMDLVNNLPEKVIVIRSVEDDPLVEASSHFPIDEAGHEGVGHCGVRGSGKAGGSLGGDATAGVGCHEDVGR